jgi:hypothetical protein
MPYTDEDVLGPMCMRCKYCKGTGKVLLFYSYVDCLDCEYVQERNIVLKLLSKKVEITKCK